MLSLAHVDLTVSAQVTVILEGFRTKSTFVWFLPSVNPAVCYQVTALVELGTAYLTLVRLLSCL